VSCEEGTPSFLFKSDREDMGHIREDLEPTLIAMAQKV
jgi:hypothetical protein